MSFFTRKRPTPEPTLAQVHELAKYQAERAISVFGTVVNDLREAAIKHNEVAESVQDEIHKLRDLQDEALERAGEAFRQANAIGALLNG